MDTDFRQVNSHIAFQNSRTLTPVLMSPQETIQKWRRPKNDNKAPFSLIVKRIIVWVLMGALGLLIFNLTFG